MPLSTLLNTPITIIQRGNADEDTFGRRNSNETPVETVGELQQTQRSEPNTEGEFSDTSWLLILPADTSIDTGDAVEADGQTFEVVGAPWEARNPRTQAPSHIEVTLRRTGSEAGS